MTLGRPDLAAPFVQIRLPESLKYQGKNGRSWSFVPEGSSAMPRGTQRTYATAKASAVQWAESWFKSLSAEKQANLQSKYSETSFPAAPESNRKREAIADENAASKKPREA